LFRIFADEQVSRFPRFIENAKSFLESRASDNVVTFFEEKYRRTITVSYVRTIGLFDWDVVSTEWPSLLDLLLRLLRLLRHGTSDDEAIAILTVVEFLARKVGVEECRAHPDLYPSLLEVGSSKLTTSIHTILFRILGFIGLVKPKVEPKTIWMDDKENSSFPEYLLTSGPEKDRLLCYFRHCSAVLFRVLDDKSLSKLHRSALDSLCRMIFICRACSESGLKESFERVFRRLMKENENCESGDDQFGKMVEFVCYAPTKLLVPVLNQLVRMMVKFRIVAPLASLMTNLTAEFRPFVQTFLPVLFASPANNGTVSGLAKIAKFYGDEVTNIVEHFVAIGGQLGRQGLFEIVSAWPVGDSALAIVRFCVANIRILNHIPGVLCWVMYRHQDDPFLVVLLEPIMRDIGPRFDILRDTPVRLDPRDRQAMAVQAASLPDPSLPQSDPQNERFLDYFAGFKRTFSGVDKWFVSLRDFCIQFPKHSLIDLCRNVARRSEVVARDIFKVAFHAVCRHHQPANATKPFYELFACVGNQFRDVLSFAETPPHIAIALTTLIEFMDRAALPIIPLTEWDSSLLYYRHPLVLRSLILKQETHPCPEELSRAYLNAGMLQESHQFASLEYPKCAVLCDDFEEIARVGGPRFAQGHAAVIDSISQAQLLMELQELSGDSFQTRLRDMSEFFNVIYPILLTRIDRKKETKEEKMMFLRLAARANE
jgi:hypothetical protein